jgi:hypothetical protein
MKAKHLFLAIAVLLVAAGLWLALTASRSHASQKLSVGISSKTQRDSNFDPKRAASLPSASQKGQIAGVTNRPQPGHMLRPPDPSRRFRDFTPEQRVKFARQGHGPGG